MPQTMPRPATNRSAKQFYTYFQPSRELQDRFRRLGIDWSLQIQKKHQSYKVKKCLKQRDFYTSSTYTFDAKVMDELAKKHAREVRDLRLMDDAWVGVYTMARNNFEYSTLQDLRKYLNK